MDFLFLTETWLKPGEYSQLLEASPPDYVFYSSPRLSGHGGGLAVINRDCHKCTLITTNYELLALKFSCSKLVDPVQSSVF